jgi:hypothetical protein
MNKQKPVITTEAFVCNMNTLLSCKQQCDCYVTVWHSHECCCDTTQCACAPGAVPASRERERERGSVAPLRQNSRLFVNIANLIHAALEGDETLRLLPPQQSELLPLSPRLTVTEPEESVLIHKDKEFTIVQAPPPRSRECRPRTYRRIHISDGSEV